jgi:hypothetical protein
MTGVSVTKMESGATEIMIKIGYGIVFGGQGGRYKFKVEFRVEVAERL